VTFTAAFRADDGTIYMAAQGIFARLDARDRQWKKALEPFPMTPNPSGLNYAQVDDLDGSRGSAPFEIFAVGFWGWVGRFDGRHWTLLGQSDTDVRGDARRHVVWLGPGEAIISGGAGVVGHVVDGVLVRETLGVEGGNVTAVGFWPGVGSVALWTKFKALSTASNLLVSVGGAWVLLDPTDLTKDGVNGFVMPPFPGGGFIAGKDGVLAHYTESLGLCPVTRLDGGWEIDYSTMMNGRPVLGGFVGTTPKFQSVLVFMGQ
jgi:hypothetical protein